MEAGRKSVVGNKEEQEKKKAKNVGGCDERTLNAPFSSTRSYIDTISFPSPGIHSGTTRNGRAKLT
jgi:hypothetical protein